MLVAVALIVAAGLGLMGGVLMFFAIALILLVLWLLGAIVVPVGTGAIHLLLIIVVVVLVYQLLVRGRNIT